MSTTTVFVPPNFDEVLDLTQMPAEALAIGVGAIVGITLFVVTMLVFARGGGSKKSAPRRPSYQAAWSRHQPAPSARASASSSANANDLVFIPPSPARAFTPSSALSARVFAKMGYELKNDLVDHHPAAAIAMAIPHEDEEAAISSGEVCVVGGTAPMPVLRSSQATIISSRIPTPTQAAAVAVPSVPSPLPSVECVFDDSPPPPSSAETGPASIVSMPAATAVVETLQAKQTQPAEIAIIRGGNLRTMRAAPMQELDFDDAPTHLCEPLFDEPPQPLRRSSHPPKIRKIDPTRPRSPSQPDTRAQPLSQSTMMSGYGMIPTRGQLPRVTPPPFSAVPPAPPSSQSPMHP